MKSFLFTLIFLGLATVSTLSAQTRLPGAGSNSSVFFTAILNASV